MTEPTDPMDNVLRRTVLKASAATVGALAMSTSATAGDDDSDDAEPIETPELDLETLEAEFEGETLQAEPLDNTYVGEVTDDLFIGVSLSGDDTEQSQEIRAYLCDGDATSIWLTGEYDAGGVTLADENTEVKLAMVDGEFLGAATLAGEKPVPFLATEATGDAGLYEAETVVDEVYVGERERDNVEVVVRWVVLSDGRQRGNAICCVCCWLCAVCYKKQ